MGDNESRVLKMRTMRNRVYLVQVPGGTYDLPARTRENTKNLSKKQTGGETQQTMLQEGCEKSNTEAGA
jgi:hypothetical protein